VIVIDRMQIHTWVGFNPPDKVAGIPPDKIIDLTPS
jgi:hypothetical protein